MSIFDSRARNWDANPMHMNRSLAIAGAMVKRIDFTKINEALEYGAGTGDLSFLLKDSISHITTMDSSQEMVNVMNEKLTTMGIGNVEPMFYDIETNEYSEKTFDLMYMQMVLHHVGELLPFLQKCNALLNKGGILAVTDLYKEDGLFHGTGFTGHQGFDIVELSLILEKAGFSNIAEEQCYKMERIIENGKTRTYPIFLLTAIK